jgi:CheY-like chemotaxis protein
MKSSLHWPRIVLINDEPFIMELWTTLIRVYFKNPTILCFEDGDLAWQELLQIEPDLLITDMCHPGMDGWRMLSLLAARKVNYPIVVWTATTEHAVRQCAADLSGLNLRIIDWNCDCVTFFKHVSILVCPSHNPKCVTLINAASANQRPPCLVNEKWIYKYDGD